MSGVVATLRAISREKLPPTVGITQRGTTDTTISFLSQFFGLATSVSIKNRHATNVLSYRTQSPIASLDEIPSSGVDTVSDTYVDFLQLVGVAGVSDWIVSAQVLSFLELKKLGIL